MKLTRVMYRAVNAVLGLAGVRLVRDRSPAGRIDFPIEFDEQDKRVVSYVLDRELTMVSAERLFATLMACKHVCASGIEGDFVECGVWRGGNALIAGDVFGRMAPSRSVYLFDTFAGMTTPSEHDVLVSTGASAMDKYLKMQNVSHNDWCFASVEDVAGNLRSYGISSDRVRLIKGDVLQTLRSEENLPEKCAVLRLDTDWYESTRMELEVMWPRLQPGGVLIVDDYGHWGGARKAVDEFFAGFPSKPFLIRSDHEGRIAVKR